MREQRAEDPASRRRGKDESDDLEPGAHRIAIGEPRLRYAEKEHDDDRDRDSRDERDRDREEEKRAERHERGDRESGREDERPLDRASDLVDGESELFLH